jgi:hypothetical protein
MEQQERLYRLLVGQSSPEFDAELQVLLKSNSGFTLYSTSAIDVLFFWIFRQCHPSEDMSLFLSQYLDLHSVIVSQPYCRVQLLLHLAKEIGLETPLLAHVVNTHRSSNSDDNEEPIDYHALSRVLICRAEQLKVELDEVVIARDACFHLHKCDFLASLHALQCLRAIEAQNGEYTLDERISDFLCRAEDYLFEVIELYPSAILLWEKTLLQKLSFKFR